MLSLPLLALLLTFTFSIKSAESQCRQLDVSLLQKIENEGFHKDIGWLIERHNQSLDCQLLIMLEVGPEMFFDPYQITHLNRTKNLPMLITGNVNVEVPAHLGTPHVAYLFAPSKERNYFNIPFHLRYQRAQISGSFGKVVLNKPSILAKCPQICDTNLVKAPCDVSNKKVCSWNNVSYQALFDEAELLVPIGNLNDYPLVSVVTLLLGCAGCIYTLSVLSTTSL